MDNMTQSPTTWLTFRLAPNRTRNCTAHEQKLLLLITSFILSRDHVAKAIDRPTTPTALLKTFLPQRRRGKQLPFDAKNAKSTNFKKKCFSLRLCGE
jgi:hypothetical protein